jgi:hypothetical protein
MSEAETNNGVVRNFQVATIQGSGIARLKS